MRLRDSFLNLLGAKDAHTNTVNEAQKTSNQLLRSGRDFLRYGNREQILPGWADVHMSDEDMYRGYSYAVIQKRGNKVASLAKENLRTFAKPEVVDAFQKEEEIVEHPYLKMIRNSSKFTEKQFWKNISIYLDLAGRYYLGVVRKEIKPLKDNLPIITTDIQEFILLNPYEIRRVIDKDHKLAGYVERKKDGRYREWPKYQIIEMRELNPFNSDDGQWAMTDAAKEAVFTLNQSGDYTRQSISGNIDAPGIITTDVILENEDFENFKSRVAQHKRGEPLFGNGPGAIKWDSMQVDLDKAALLDINEINRTTLFAVSGTSKTSLGIEQSGTTRETARVQSEQFVSDTAQPRLEDIVDFLNLDYKRHYAQEFDKTGYSIYVQSAVGKDYDSETKATQLRQVQIELAMSLMQSGYTKESAYQYAQGDIELSDLELEKGLDKPKTGDDNPEGEEGNTPQTPPEAPQGGSNGGNGSSRGSENESDSGTNNGLDLDLEPHGDLVENSGGTTDAHGRVHAPAGSPQGGQFVKKTGGTSGSDGRGESNKAEDDFDKEMDETLVSAKEEAESMSIGKLIALVDEADEGNGYSTLIEHNVRRDLKDEMADAGRDEDYFEFTDALRYQIPAETLKKKVEKLSDDEILESSIDDLLGTSDRRMSSYGDDNMRKVIFKVDDVVSKRFDELQKKLESEGYVVSTDDSRISESKYFAVWDGNEENVIEARLADHSSTGSGGSVDTYVYYEDDYGNSRTIRETLDAFEEAVREEMDAADLKPKKNSVEEQVHNTVCPDCENKLEDLRNENKELDKLYQGFLKEISTLELEMVEKASRRVTVNAFSEDDIVGPRQKKNYLDKLKKLLSGYWGNLFVLFGKDTVEQRNREFNTNQVFTLDNSMTERIDDNANRVADGHYQTIVNDILGVANRAYTAVAEGVAADLIVEAYKVNPDKFADYFDSEPSRADALKSIQKTNILEENKRIYEKANKMAYDGYKRADIVKAIRESYPDIKENRATLIAGNETARAYGRSQYEADLQFLRNTGMMGKAYKRLVSSRPEGDRDKICPFCASLIEKTKNSPIPFTEPFLKFGDSIEVVENGAVKNFTANYESIEASTVHCGCFCHYELIIKENNANGDKVSNVVVSTDDNNNIVDNSDDGIGEKVENEIVLREINNDGEISNN